ncbi:hypothetical protein HPB52_013256 [Rhipicephalus sanguineus]|uniref:Uncharacterized protein n=1 Tax=Rhipicephalus sanguineus TaxID=34632 RepID=A0A9D4SRG4_RHISA|nr:hypothetical protein HPB52_013256 [Rhipicephalus sanguineus]
MSHVNQVVQAGAVYVDEEPKHDEQCYSTHGFSCRRDGRLQLSKRHMLLALLTRSAGVDAALDLVSPGGPASSCTAASTNRHIAAPGGWSPRR